jgi:hypothetical protein
VTEIQTFAFGEAADGTWGVAWIPHAGASARVAVGRGDTQGIVEVELDARAPDDTWKLHGAGVSLSIAPAEPVARGGAAGGLQSSDRLCTVSGQVQIAGASADVASPGWRSTATTDADLAGFESIRWLAAWLGVQEGFSLTALRPRRARGHDADVLAATLIDDPPPPPIDDPRLSTTYAESGLPARVGLELWFQAPDEDEPDGAPSRDYPRRAAGDITGRPLEWEAAGFDLHALRVDWRSHGREGPGVYLLAQRR